MNHWKFCSIGLSHLGASSKKNQTVTDPISEAGLEDLWKRLLEVETSLLILSPYGGKKSEIPDSETPFPHRSGNIFQIQYLVTWDDDKETEKHIGWMRKLYACIHGTICFQVPKSCIFEL